MSEWQKADSRVAASAAVIAQEEQRTNNRAAASATVIAQEEQRAKDQATCAAAILKRSPTHKKADRYLEPGPDDRPEGWRQLSSRPYSLTTGYIGVRPRGQQYRALCGTNYLSSYRTTEEAALIHNWAAINRSISAGYNKHKLNFSRVRTKRLRSPEASTYTLIVITGIWDEQQMASCQ